MPEKAKQVPVDEDARELVRSMAEIMGSTQQIAASLMLRLAPRREVIARHQAEVQGRLELAERGSEPAPAAAPAAAAPPAPSPAPAAARSEPAPAAHRRPLAPAAAPAAAAPPAPSPAPAAPAAPPRPHK